jgi:hypothetical protein
MKNSRTIVGLIGAMTMLFSFSSISQEQRTTHDKVEYAEVGIHQKLKTDIAPKNIKMEAIKCKVHPKYLLARMNASKSTEELRQKSFREPLRYKK